MGIEFGKGSGMLGGIMLEDKGGYCLNDFIDFIYWVRMDGWNMII